MWFLDITYLETDCFLCPGRFISGFLAFAHFCLNLKKLSFASIQHSIEKRNPLNSNYTPKEYKIYLKLLSLLLDLKKNLP